MPNILFASNNASHWPGVITVTTQGTYDSARVPYALQINYDETMSSPEFIATTNDVTWIHYRTFFDSIYNFGDYNMVRAYAENGDVLFSFDKIYGITVPLCVLTLYKGSGTMTMDQTFPLNKDKINSIDVRYESTGTLTKVGLYINGGLAGELEHASDSLKGQPSHFSIGAAFCNFGDNTMEFSEFLVADGDTRNARLDLLRPTAAGGETDWVGEAAALADDDPTSGMTSIAAEERQTLAMSAYGGASNISAVVIATQSLAGANGPQNLRHTVRMSTVNYDGPSDYPLGDVLQFNVTDFKINPATSLPWVGADIASMEMGFISKA